MASHEAWLGPFVADGLAEYLRFLQTGQPMVEGSFLGDWWTGLLIGMQTPQTTPVQVTDGKHCLPAVFRKATQEGLERSGVKPAHLTRSKVNLQVTDPTLIIDCNYDTPQLRLSISTCEAVENECAKAIDQFDSLPLETLPDVQQKMLELTQWCARNRKNNPPKGSPSGSIRSQAPLSPGNASDADDDVSQLPFLTQINDVTWDQQPQRLSPSAIHKETVTTGLMHNERTNGATQTTIKDTRLHQGDAATGQDEEDLTTNFVTQPVVHGLTINSQPAENHIAPADGDLSTKALDGKQGVHGRESAQDELGPSYLEAAKEREQIIGAAQQPDPMLAPESKERPSQLPTSLVRHFRRWREEARSGRYIPRYLQKIPKDQEALLESDDSWQPPLVGRTVIPGQIPIHLNEQLMILTDQKDSQVEKQLPINEPISACQKSITPDNHHKKTLQERRLVNAASDSEESDVSAASWSPSPPTQDRRRQVLPADSPLPSARKRRNFNVKSADIDIEAPPRTRSVSSTHGNDNQPLLSQSTSQISRLPVIPHSDLVTNRAVSEVDQGVRRVPIQSLGEPTTSKPIAPDTLEGISPAAISGSFAGPKKATSPSKRNIQVERTPYILKRPLPHLVKTAFNGTDITDESGLASSGCVPCSYDERNCALLPAVQASSDVPSIESCTVPQTDTLQPNHASSGDPASGHRHLIPNENVQQLKSAPQTNENKDDKGPRVNAAEDEIGILSRSVDSARLDSTSDRSRRADSSPSRNDHRVEAKSQTAGSGSETAQGDPAVQVILDALTSHDQSIEVIGDADNTRTGPTKYTAPVAANSSDPAYVAELGHHCRTALKSISKQPSLSRKSTSSAKDATSSVGKLPSAPTGDGSPSLRTSAPSPRQLSTPVTHSSAYGNVEDPFKLQSNDSPSQVPTTLVIHLHLVFRRYQNAYTDYRGDFTAFENACRLLSKFWVMGKGLHSYLYDDAIYHHHHGFRRYLLDEAAEEETRIMTFDEYYLQRVDEPTHTKRIVTKAMIETLIRPRRLDAYGQGKSPRRTSDAATSPFPNATETVSVLPQPIILPEAPILDAHDRHYVSQSGSAVAQWRREVSRLPSPELGTPHVNRNQTEISSPEITNSEIGCCLPLATETDRPAQQPFSTMSLQHPKDIEMSKKRKRQPTFRTTVPIPLETEASITPKRIKYSKPSASPFVKPSHPASSIVSTLQMTPAQKAKRWARLQRRISLGT
ncbi:uncharacterized protein PV06_05654 [Exophiala oligosperma]|uniref:Telomere replication protein EST3 n=1 Tax=Exophiala oligosperma TaxID=215243 RepID=A0A0D2DI33_9EURO|nr:uncharacterized protein PV06_05654 [Exophiala oligosperma]KIW42070.1 hypothetical protein PV06_05654 [Exophiala oligosperma]